MQPRKINLFGARGTALFTVLLFTFVMSALVAGVLMWSWEERYTTTRYSRWLEARNAAEALCEYGFAQVYNEYSVHQIPSKTYFDPAGTTGLTMAPSSFFGSNVEATLSQLVAGTEQDITTYGNSLYLIPSGSSDPGNVDDPAAPSSGVPTAIERRDVRVVAKATVASPDANGAPITAYVSETCSVRGDPLFGFAVFYSNNDLEVQPGPTMNINGPVHVNGNLYVSNQNGGTDSVNFQNKVTISGDVFHAWAGLASTNTASTEGALGTGAVTFLSVSGTKQITMDLNGAATSWRDSTYGTDYKSGSNVSGTVNLIALVTPTATAAFEGFEGTTWGSNLLTGPQGGATMNPVEFNQVIGMDGTTSVYPNFHTLIDPPVQVSTSSNPYSGAQVETEEQKLAYLSGLYIKVTVTTGGIGQVGTMGYAIYGMPGSAAALGVTAGTDIGPNDFDPTNTMTGGLLLNQPTNATPITGVGTTGVANPLTSPVVNTAPLISFIPFARSLTTAYKSKTTGTTLGNAVIQTTDGGTGAISYTGTLTASIAAGTTVTAGTAVTAIVSGMVDQRRYQNGFTTADVANNTGPLGVDKVIVNIPAITEAVNDMVNNVSATSDSNALTYSLPGSTTKLLWTGWNGGIYIDVETAGSTAVTAASVPSPTGTAGYTNGDSIVNGSDQAKGYVYNTMQEASVFLVNGTVPNGSSLIPAAASNLYEYPGSTTVNPYGNGNGVAGGLTIATNAPVYIVGSYNADGMSTTGSDIAPDNGFTGSGAAAEVESPSYIASDSITILSPGWSDSNSLTIAPAAAGTTWTVGTSTATATYPIYSEIAAALVTGLTPTGTYYSGGLHNLPRFLEDWSPPPSNAQQTVTIRGAISNFFPSAIASQPWFLNEGSLTGYYSAPTRDWGYDNVFSAGYMPPMTPRVETFRRYYYSDMSSVQYTSALHAMWPSEF